MLTLKQVFTKNLTSQCQSAFSTARVRNFFELDPIFPDHKDPDQFLDVARLPFSHIYAKQHQQKIAYFEHFIKEAHKKFPDEDLSKKKPRLPKATKIAKKDDAFKKFASRILEDPDLGLPYGFGFDEYIQQLKVHNMSASNDLFLFTLNNLFDQLDVTTDIELVQFHKNIIIDKTKHNFEDRAKAIIASHLATEVQRRRLKNPEYKRLIQKLITDEALAEKMSSPDWKPTEENIKLLIEKIDPSRINNAARNLAKENIDKTILVHKGRRMKQTDIDQATDIQNRLRHTWLKGKVVNPARGEYQLAEELSLKFRQYPIESVGLSPEEFRKFEIRSEINDVYITERDRHINQKYGGQIRATGNKKKDKKRLEEETEERVEEEKDFFHKLNEAESDVRDLENVLGLTSQSAPSFRRIYEELDRVLENAPLSIKKTYNCSKTSHFEPQIAHLSVNPDELFWGRIGKYLSPILPATLNENPHLAVPVMKEVLRPPGATTADIEEENENQRKPRQPQQKIEIQSQFDVSELTQEMKREMEIFKMVKNEPYFKHYITNELNYYADRMNDHFSMIFAGIQMQETRPNDYMKFDAPKLAKMEKMVRRKAMLEPVLYHGRAYGGATRKTTKAMAVVKEGTGKIRVNRKDFLYYFGQTSERSLVIEPLMVSGYSIGLDVDLFLWGGGEHSQAEAGSLALARALVKYNPAVKAAMRENGLLNHDPRQTERKHVGKYKARAKFPYSRR